MSYISPNSTVKLLKGVPLDKGYNHTLFFRNITQQISTFQSYIKATEISETNETISYSLTNYSYQRVNKDKIRVSIPCDHLYDCNYMMFQNTAFSGKWFYAFIDDVTYINNNTAEIKYTIDVMQTWYFEYELGECFVEREHTISDNYGEHLIPENIKSAEMVVENKWEFTYPDSIVTNGIMFEIVVMYVPNNDKGYISGVHTENGVTVYDITSCKTSSNPTQYNTGSILNGVYLGCKYWGIPFLLNADLEETKKEIDNLINTIINESGGVGGKIVNISQVPYYLWLDWTNNGGSTAMRDCNHDLGLRFYNSDKTKSFVPKNKKMYTDPFRKIIVSNNAGQSASYKWEYFNTVGGIKKSTFKVGGVPMPSTELMCYPTNYRGLTEDYENGIMLTDFPRPPWNEDSFAKWWTENKRAYIDSLIATGLAAVVGATVTIASGGTALPVAVGVTAATSAAVKGLSSIGQYQSAKDTPDQISGQSSVSSIRIAQNRIGYYFYDMGAEYDIAKSIDDYFSMYGYAINKVKQPNIRMYTDVPDKQNKALRPQWNYIKTSGCIIHSASGKGMPSDDEDTISKIYDRGITFWINPDNVGDYSQDNSPYSPA